MEKSKLERILVGMACKKAGVKAFESGITPTFKNKYYHVSEKEGSPTLAYAYVEIQGSVAQVFLMRTDKPEYKAYAMFATEHGVEVNQLVQKESLEMAERLFKPLLQQLKGFILVQHTEALRLVLGAPFFFYYL